MPFSIKEVTKDKANLCRRILSLLPEWFGLQDATENYAQESERLLMLGCFDNDTSTCVGFLALKESTIDAAEIFVMGVRPDFHRRGAGTALVHEAEKRAQNIGKTFLFVKTLSSHHPDPHYANTRQFYARTGFKELGVFPMIWGEENPCLILAKIL